MNLLCEIGIHKWGKEKLHTIMNFPLKSSKCERCDAYKDREGNVYIGIATKVKR